MLVSLNWLRNYVDFDELSPEELAEKITKSGIEVDGIEYIRSEKSTNVVVGYVKECEQHPNADKLKLCKVDAGEDTELQIICGAPNVAAGQKVAVAKPGAVLPGNFKIKKVKLRGIESNGMICSLKELGVDEKFIPAQFKEGIMVLDEQLEVGQSVDEYLNLDDAILEFDLTPNRADALSMMGVAYEVAAILGKEIKLPEPAVETSSEKASDHVELAIQDKDLCSYYGAYLIKDITVKDSPLWMQNYLLAAGVRPINNVVDITNYVLMEYGQPLHAFDYDLIGTGKITVRRARDKEQIVTLDGQTRKLNVENLLITDGDKGIALAGVMGGQDTEVHDGTKTVLLETAYFDGAAVRKAVKQTGLRSEASTRFEKGVDPNRVREAGLRACELLKEYADATVLTGLAEVNHFDIREVKITMPAEKVNQRLGTQISVDEMENILQKLRFDYDLNGNEFTVLIPSRRGDITIFEDMLEEVARIYGYDHLPYTLPANASKPGGLTDKQLLKRKIKAYMESAGFSEAITYSLLNKNDIQKFISPEQSEGIKPVALSMPMSEDHQYLRQSLIPELLNRAAYNTARKQQDIALYEAGSVFLSEEDSLTNQPAEQLRLSGVITGKWVNQPWQQDVKPVDFYTLKGILEGLFAYIDRNFILKQAQLPELHPGRTATIQVDGETVGFIGQVHPAYLKELDLKDTYVFDLNLAFILETTNPMIQYETIPKYPSIARDIAFVMNKDIQAGDVRNLIIATGASLVKNVDIFDVYTGDNVKENEKSIALNIHFQDPEKTLTDQEVDETMQEIISAVNGKYQTYVRS